MSNHGFTIALFALFGVALQAQEFSETQKVKDFGRFVFEVGAYEKTAIMLKNKPRDGWYLEKVSESLDVIASARLEMMSKYTRVRHIYILGDIIHVTRLDYADKKYALTHRRYRAFDFSPLDSEWRKIGSVEGRPGLQSPFSIQTSNSEEITAVLAESRQAGKSLKAFQLSVYDKEMNRIWHEGFVLDYNANVSAFTDFVVTDDGAVYLLTEHSEQHIADYSVRWDPISDFDTRLIRISNRGVLVNDRVLPHKDVLLRDVAVVLPKLNKDPILIGYYSEDERDRAVDGIFGVKLSDTDDEFYEEFYTPFRSSLAQEYAVTHARKSKAFEEGYSNLRTTHLWYETDGSILIAAQLSAGNSRSVGRKSRVLPLAAAASGTSSGNLVYVKLDSEGNVTWDRMVFRSQGSGVIQWIDKGKIHACYSISSLSIRKYYRFAERPSDLPSGNLALLKIETDLNDGAISAAVRHVPSDNESINLSPALRVGGSLLYTVGLDENKLVGYAKIAIP